jgi:hypothetical protein
MAPAKILSISPDRETYIVEIAYDPVKYADRADLRERNGRQLRLDVLNVDPYRHSDRWKE